MAETIKLNKLQIEAWQVIEFLLERHLNMATVPEIAEGLTMDQFKIRRILFTWKKLGIVRTRESLWQLSDYFVDHIPLRIKFGIYDRYNFIEEIKTCLSKNKEKS